MSIVNLTRNFCSSLPKCVKCEKNHITLIYDKSSKNPVTHVLCNDAHSANSKSYIMYKNVRQISKWWRFRIISTQIQNLKIIMLTTRLSKTPTSTRIISIKHTLKTHKRINLLCVLIYLNHFWCPSRLSVIFKSINEFKLYSTIYFNSYIWHH